MKYAAPKVKAPRYAALKVFAEAPLRRRIIVLACLLAGSLAEGAGIATMLPVLTLAMGSPESGKSSQLSKVMADILTAIGLPLEIEVLLPIVLLMTVLSGLLSLFALSRVGFAVADVTTGLRRSLIDALLHVNWGYFARQPVGRLGNAISGEANRGGEAWLNVTQFASQIFQALVYLTLALLVSWKIFLAAVVIGGALIVSLNGFVRRARRAGRQQTKRTKRLVTRLTDTLIGVKPLKAMGRHEHFGELFARDVRELNRALRKQVVARQLSRVLQEPIVFIFLLAGFYATLSVSSIRGADLILILMLTGRTALSIGRLQQTYQAIIFSESAYWSIKSAIAEAQAAKEIILGTTVPTLTSACALENVSFAFAKKIVLNDVSITIPAGRITAITGLSGAGKTTIADLLLGLYRPDCGEIRIDGVPLPDVDLLRWRRMVGYVPQEVILFHDTIFANLTLDEPGLSRDAAKAALEAAGAWAFVAQLPDQLDSLVGERGTLLSGGQRQRIAVARALIHGPSLLILDEATSALDPDTEAEICRSIRSLSAATGLTVLAISHQRAWIEAADQVYHLEKISDVAYLSRR